MTPKCRLWNALNVNCFGFLDLAKLHYTILTNNQSKKLHGEP